MIVKENEVVFSSQTLSENSQESSSNSKLNIINGIKRRRELFESAGVFSNKKLVQIKNDQEYLEKTIKMMEYKARKKQEMKEPEWEQIESEFASIIEDFTGIFKYVSKSENTDPDHIRKIIFDLKEEMRNIFKASIDILIKK